MGKSAKVTKRLTKEAKRTDQTTKSSSKKEEILGPKSNSSTKISKKQNKRKARVAKFKRGKVMSNDKERDYVDIFIGKSTYKKALNEK
ncbi:2740_t:CDS:2 [Dentiscutata heterogama]|uniref:2740_t:CDS:1 n=1 Tax=Dentiscutata heterogama TaxID=1316150 RepID=A0ACA9KH44_9GLOM|nr:2740_t:CDS:2 [Dentiscutata heterogama]